MHINLLDTHNDNGGNKTIEVKGKLKGRGTLLDDVSNDSGKAILHFYNGLWFEPNIPETGWLEFEIGNA